MPDSPYAKFEPEELILRDELAIDRTILASERTALAYTRTALTLIIAGLSFLHFVQEGLLYYAAWMFLPAGVLTSAFGFMRFRKIRRHILSVRKKAKLDETV